MMHRGIALRINQASPSVGTGWSNDIRAVGVIPSHKDADQSCSHSWSRSSRFMEAVNETRKVTCAESLQGERYVCVCVCVASS